MASQGPSAPRGISPTSHLSTILVKSAYKPASVSFVGREYERNIIKQALQSSNNPTAGQKRFSITGISGQGKTALCAKIVEELRQEFSDVIWIDASTAQAAQECFAPTAEGSASTAADISSTLQYLANRKDNWLLVLDNANDPTAEYFPPCQHGSIIIITRDPSIALRVNATSLALRRMTTADSVVLLQKSLDWPLSQGTEEAYWAEHAAFLLENHALSLILAGAYIAKRRCTFTSYVSAYEAEKTVLQPTQANSTSPYISAYTACELSAKTLTSTTGVASLALLSVLSRLPYDPIALDTAGDVWNHIPTRSNGRPDAAVRPSLPAALNQLSSLAFVTAAADRIAIHPIVRAWAQDRQNSSSAAGNDGHLLRLPPPPPPPPPSHARSPPSPYHRSVSLPAQQQHSEVQPATHGLYSPEAGDVSCFLQVTPPPPPPAAVRSRKSSPYRWAAGPAALAVQSPRDTAVVEYFGEVDGRELDLFSDGEGSDKEGMDDRGRYLAVVDEPGRSRNGGGYGSGSRSRIGEDVWSDGGGENGRRRSRRRRRHGSRGRSVDVEARGRRGGGESRFEAAAWAMAEGLVGQYSPHRRHGRTG